MAAKKIPKITLQDRIRAVCFYRRHQIDMLSCLQRYHQQYGPVMMQRWGSWRIVNLAGPDANRFVLLDRDGIFMAKRPWDAIMGRIFRNGLLLRDGEDHRRHRTLMKDAFSHAALTAYVSQMHLIVEETVAAWREKDGIFFVYPALKQLTLTMAARIFIGIELGEEARRINTIFAALVAASMQFYQNGRGREWLAAYFTHLIPHRRAGGGNDLFSRLCRAVDENGDRLTNEEIVDHTIFVMMAAHDTTTSAMTSMTYELAKNPAWQDRVRQESRGIGTEHLGFREMERLEMLTWVIRETLRLYPPLPVIPRSTTADFEFQGYVVPKHAVVVIAPLHTHYMHDWWDDPCRFDPWRFSPQRAEHERHSHSWIPFGGGRHMCLGIQFAELQIKVVMYHLLQHYRWSVPEGYRMPVQQSPIAKPMDGLPVRLFSTP